jgi:hypothetical protein
MLVELYNPSLLVRAPPRCLLENKIDEHETDMSARLQTMNDTWTRTI